MQRRQFIAWGAAATTLLAAGAASRLWHPALIQGRLTPAGQEVMAAVAQAVLQGSLPAWGAARADAVQRLLQRFETITGSLPEPVQEELAQLLGLLASTAGRRGLAGMATPWNEATPTEVRAALQGMRTSSLGLRRQAYQALHELVGAAYFSDRTTWAAIGYPGPLSI